jgi:hypothetical protein
MLKKIGILTTIFNRQRNLYIIDRLARLSQSHAICLNRLPQNSLRTLNYARNILEYRSMQ